MHDLGVVFQTGQGLQVAGQRQEYATEHTGRDPTPPLWRFHSRCPQIRNSVKTASLSRTRVLECLRPSQETDRRPQSRTSSNFCADVKSWSRRFHLAVSRGGFRDRRVADAANEDGERCPTWIRYPNTGDTARSCNATPPPAEPSAQPPTAGTATGTATGGPSGVSRCALNVACG